MKKQELLDKIDKLLKQAKEDQGNAKRPLDEMFYIGQVNGLLWAKNVIINSEED